MQSSPIDFVVPWVDGDDPQWQAQRSRYTDEPISSVQYRDWGIFRYWFRSVERYAPWVNRIHLVTCGQWPQWLNTHHPKLHCVHHADYIPEQYLPTFSANVIELNLHRIPGLSEHFVYFNDDTFLNGPVSPDFFFSRGLPRESAVLSALTPTVPGDPFAHILCNDTAVINAHFSKAAVMNGHFWKWYDLRYGKYLLKNLYHTPTKYFSGFHNFHMPSAMRKSTYEAVWALEPELLHRTCRNRFRSPEDVNQYLMTYYNLCQGTFLPRSASVGRYYEIGEQKEALRKDLLTGKHKMICINDTHRKIDPEAEQKWLQELFAQAFPNKSYFEK